MKKHLLVVAALGLALLAGTACLWPEFIVQNDYTAPKAAPDDSLADDELEDKPAAAFDPALTDRRPLGEWQLNASAALVRLDIVPTKPDVEADLLKLYPSYAAAAAAARKHGDNLLLSVNMVDGKAKQFDDGLYAALDQAYYRGLSDKLLSHVELIRRLYDRVGPNSAAAPFLAAGLELAGVRVPVADAETKNRLLANFLNNDAACKPVGFYGWTESLTACFQFLRFFQTEFGPDHLDVPLALARALAGDPPLLADYRKAQVFYAHLTNPALCYHLGYLISCQTADDARNVLSTPKRQVRDSVAVFPASSSRENTLMEKLFPTGLPENASLMHELISRVRSGKIDLRPDPDSGWYDRQVYALETLLLVEKGEEHAKLLLTKAYKKRMLEAFQALMTKRRETHVRQFTPFIAGAAPPGRMFEVEKVQPRLRVEPCPSYFLRTARAYAFLADFLEAAVGADGLHSLHGLRPGGQREPDLFTELHFMRDLNYGLHLVSAEDIGMKPALHPQEPIDAAACYDLAVGWLAKAFDDPDMTADTRVAVPVAVDVARKITLTWATLGVRVVQLESSYARPPSIKLAGGGDWQPVRESQLGKVIYQIAVDEFAEVDFPGNRTLTREELRAVCDGAKTKEAIVAALRHLE